MSTVFFPTTLNKLAYSSTKNEKWNTTIQTSGSGMSRSMTNQLYPEWTIKTKLVALTDAETRTLMGFVALRKGAYEPFYWYDPEDNTATAQRLATVTSGLVYQCVIPVGGYSEPAEYTEVTAVYVNGTAVSSSTYTVSNGVVTFTSSVGSSATVTADYTYWWKVRFDDDGMGITHVFDDINNSDSFSLVTVR